MSPTIAVIDFETSGLPPQAGGRATEIAAVLLRDGEIVDQYQSLMRTDVWVPPFIERLTGISNAMLAQAPPAATVMREVADFTRGSALVAHNASFDRGFWRAEHERAGLALDPLHEEFACTVLLARRLYPEAPDCKLGTLARYHRLPDNGRAHRALADARTTAQLLLRMQADLSQRYGAELGPLVSEHGLLARLQRASRTALGRCVRDYARQRLTTAQAAI